MNRVQNGISFLLRYCINIAGYHLRGSSTFFCRSDVQLEDKRYLVGQENTATVCIDLDPALDTLLKGIATSTRCEIRQAEKLR